MFGGNGVGSRSPEGWEGRGQREWGKTYLEKIALLAPKRPCPGVRSHSRCLTQTGEVEGNKGKLRKATGGFPEPRPDPGSHLILFL